MVLACAGGLRVLHHLTQRCLSQRTNISSVVTSTGCSRLGVGGPSASFARLAPMQLPSDPFQRWQTLLKYFHDNLRSGIARLVQVHNHIKWPVCERKCYIKSAWPPMHVHAVSRTASEMVLHHLQSSFAAPAAICATWRGTTVHVAPC
jgi:hypothetical protein